MDASLKELSKLEKSQVYPSAGDSSSSTHRTVSDTLESLLDSLQSLKQRVVTESNPQVLRELPDLVESKKKEVDERQKEVHASLGKLGKAIDKETGVDIPFQLREQLVEMHRILNALEAEDINPALEWVNNNRQFLSSRSSPLEFHLHRSHYLRLLFSPTHPSSLTALEYIKSISPTLYSAHANEIHKLVTCMIYLPPSRLALSPYAEFINPNIHVEVGLEFVQEYCANLGLSKQLPLRIVGDIGGGGALSRIEKGRKVMRERKSEWSQTNELPIEIPLPVENRYHSIFACPVSKEQSTETNPPMMMGCGHVVNKDSLDKLRKSAGRVKCPYCPVESFASTFQFFKNDLTFQDILQIALAAPGTLYNSSLANFIERQLNLKIVNCRIASLTVGRDPLGTKAATMLSGLGTRIMAMNEVYRYLHDGDSILVINRQPTLHKVSMVARETRMLWEEKTIQMHYANCGSISYSKHWQSILVPTSGKPMRDLIQDHTAVGL
ncbi:hypothetical protein Clacol_006400 [Clathrus columnatus]|uniref:DNA-directed RNA polymerase n=1 Tax=Clathrus columnatus TaxID=1419009 RepID=A0AAV5AHK3_9AGAM|nr:hypothetical protein Clacol_006400 [Clathrus columnatus]